MLKNSTIFKKIEAIPRPAHIGVSPRDPAISLIKWSVQLNHGDNQIAKPIKIKKIIVEIIPQRPQIFKDVQYFDFILAPLNFDKLDFDIFA